MRSTYSLAVRAFLVGLLASIVACGADPEPPAADRELRAALAGLDGQFDWNEERQRHVYSSKIELERILSQHETEPLVSMLVRCLDDLSPSASMLDGRPVAVGVVCYEGLGQTAYFEPTAPNGDIAESWPGHVSPRATAEELRVARRAWEEVVRERAFILH